MKAATQRRILLSGHRVNYEVVVSKAARKTRVRVGPGGVAVTQPPDVSDEDVSAFLRRNENWVLAQLDRVSGLRALRRPILRQLGEILYRGNPTPVRVEFVDTKARGNLVGWTDGEIIVRRGAGTRTPAVRGLENWLRREAGPRLRIAFPPWPRASGSNPAASTSWASVRNGATARPAGISRSTGVSSSRRISCSTISSRTRSCIWPFRTIPPSSGSRCRASARRRNGRNSG